MCYFALKTKKLKESPVVNQKAGETEGIGSKFANTAGFFNDAVVNRAVDDHRTSWLQRLPCAKKFVSPGKEDGEQDEGVTRKKKLRRFSSKKNSTMIGGNDMI